MRLTLRYNMTGEDTVEVTTNLGVVVAWERRFKRKAHELSQGAGVEDLLFLAWEAAKASKVVVPMAFDDFIRRVENLDVVSEEPANPSPAAPSDED